MKRNPVFAREGYYTEKHGGDTEFHGEMQKYDRGRTYIQSDQVRG